VRRGAVKRLKDRLLALRLGRRRDEGASAVEYGLLVALVAVIIAGAVLALGNALSDKFDCTATAISTGAEPACDSGSGGSGGGG
jgi:pilus assembly protein Flp/PilA